MLDPNTIVHRTECTTKQRARAYVLGVVPPGQAAPLPWREYRVPFANQLTARMLASGPHTEALMKQVARAIQEQDAALLQRWHAALDYYVAEDEDGQRLVFDDPVRFPNPAMHYGVSRPKFFPGGMPAVLPAYDPRYPHASVDPFNAQLTVSKDPWTIAKWRAWMALGFPGHERATMYRKQPDGTRRWLQHGDEQEMGNVVANVSAGLINAYAERVNDSDPTNAVLVIALWTGSQTDDEMRDADTLAAHEALGSLAESTATNYGRKVLSDSDIAGSTVDDTGNQRSFDIADQTFASLGPGTALTRATVNYDPDSTGGADSAIIPIAIYDCAITPNGGNLTLQIHASGLWTATT